MFKSGYLAQEQKSAVLGLFSDVETQKIFEKS